MSDPNLRDVYFSKIDVDPRKETSKLEIALNRAYEQRSFEIEHLWKRGAFFWAFQAAIFTASGLLWQHSGSQRNQAMLLALAALGLLTAFANSLVVRGSKFWQNNWEKHIDMLENAVEGRLYKTIWLRNGGLSFSVSGLGKVLADFFSCFWLFALLYSGILLLDLLPKADLNHLKYLFVAGVGLATLLGLSLLWREQTDFSGIRYTDRCLTGEKWSELNPSSPSFMVRDDPVPEK
ncbi:hypothetical protein [Rhodopseudomonas sp. BR0M22]|uniref:RipA family octameric membrane protein n=1 Tax=Rhodopseudomonas sp. BR0M22 TaxID=2269369 RepID=UPI0013DFD381|nr:hypothetical protein [Rhodopseudomonas sp. BR0M22]